MRKLLSLVVIMCHMMSLSATTSFAIDSWDKDAPSGSNLAADIDYYVNQNNGAIDRMESNYREGCQVYYISASSMGIKAGEVMCSNTAGTIRKMGSNSSAITLTWANIDAGAEASSKTYYVYAVLDSTTATTFTGMISTNATTPTGATYYKKLGSFYNNSDGDIVDDDTLINYNNYYALRLGDWVSKSNATVYQASTDGIVTAISTLATGTIYGYSDGSNPPTTVRNQNHAQTANYHGISFPVKKSDYYKVTGAATVYFIPLELEV